MGNLKPAPLFLTGDLVAKLTGDRPAFGRGLTRLLIEETAADAMRRPHSPSTEEQSND